MKTLFTLYCHNFFTVHSKAQMVAIGVLTICQPVALRKSLRPWKISWPLGMFHLILPSLSLQCTYSILFNLNWNCLDLKTCTGKYFWKFCQVVAQVVWQQSRSSPVLCLWHCALLIREMTNRQRVRAAAYLPQITQFSPLVVPVLETWSTSTQKTGTLHRI